MDDQPPLRVTIDEAKAASQLRELAELYVAVERAQENFAEKDKAQKTAKRELDTATDTMLAKFKASLAPPPPMPLFEDRDDVSPHIPDRKSAAAGDA